MIGKARPVGLEDSLHTEQSRREYSVPDILPGLVHLPVLSINKQFAVEPWGEHHGLVPYILPGLVHLPVLAVDHKLMPESGREQDKCGNNLQTSDPHHDDQHDLQLVLQTGEVAGGSEVAEAHASVGDCGYGEPEGVDDVYLGTCDGGLGDADQKDQDCPHDDRGHEEQEDRQHGLHRLGVHAGAVHLHVVDCVGMDHLAEAVLEELVD